MKPLAMLALCLLLVSCSTDAPVENARSDESVGPKTGSGPRTGDASAADGGSDSDENGDDPGSQPGSTDGGDSEDEGDENRGPGLFDSRAFFNDEVLPKFKASCTNCHADPRFNPPVQGPLTILNFKRMENLLRSGEGPLSNDLYEKIAGIDLHTGGDQCVVSPDVCSTIETWWQKLLGTGSSSSVLAGQVSTVTEDGRVTGWAADRADTSAAVPIRVYADGDLNTGKLVFETDANLSGFDNGTPGNHAFALQLPEEYRDGTEHTVHVYGMAGSDLVLLPGSPQTFTAYTPNPAGQAFFNNNIRAILQNQCGGCHAVDYSIQWASLLSPTPAKGGTATNNELINKPSGRISHGGGNLCGGVGGSPCSLFQQWWDLEFN